MKRTKWAVLATCLLAFQPIHARSGEVLAIRVGRAETVSGEAIEHAVILVENGKITTLGEDLPIERGIPVFDRPDWVVLPGLVNCYSRLGMESSGGSGSDPDQMASQELYARQDVWAEVLAAGVTTLGLYPPGTGIPGQAVAVRTTGDSKEEMILRDSTYLKVLLQADSGSKKMLRDGFEKADSHNEKVAKAREKWEKEQEKKTKKSKSKKKDDEKEEAEEKDEKSDSPDFFVPPEPAPDVQPFLQLRSGELSALFAIRKAADFLHLKDALGEEEITWSLRVPLRGESDLFEIADKIAEAGCAVVLDPRTSNQPSTLRERNIAADLVRAGADVALIPPGDSIANQRRWLTAVGELVRAGLDRAAALRAVTLVPAEILGVADRVGSLEPGKDANMIFFDGDPIEPATRLQAVMLEGRFITGGDLR